MGGKQERKRGEKHDRRRRRSKSLRLGAKGTPVRKRKGVEEYDILGEEDAIPIDSYQGQRGGMQ